MTPFIPSLQGDQPRSGEMLSSLAHRPCWQGSGQSPVQRLCQHLGHYKTREWRKVPDSEEEVLSGILCGHLLPGQCHTKWIFRPWLPGLAELARVAWGEWQLWRGSNNQKATLQFLSRTSFTKQVTGCLNISR